MFNPFNMVAQMDIGFEGPQDISKFDINGDGIITAQDCPYAYGTMEAKMWFAKVLEPATRHAITDEMKVQYGDKVTGAYYGKPLVPGEQGQGQGDYSFLVDKLMITQGIDKVSASSIAGKIRNMKYGS